MQSTLLPEGPHCDHGLARSLGSWVLLRVSRKTVTEHRRGHTVMFMVERLVAFRLRINFRHHGHVSRNAPIPQSTPRQ